MNTSVSPSWAACTESRPTLSGDGSRGSECEPKMVNPVPMRLRKALSASRPADIQERISGFGTQKGQLPSSTECDTRELLGPFSIRLSGNIGQEIRDPDGKIIAWTTNTWIAEVICKLLTEQEGT
jgi:hypothetical protein